MALELQTGKPAVAAGDREAMHFTVTVHHDVGALPDHWPSTDRPGDARCTVYQLRDYLAVMAGTVGAVRKRRLLYVDVRDDAGRPLLLLALALERRGAVEVLSFADFDVVDYNAPVLFPTAIRWTEPVSRRLWQEIAAALPRHDVVELLKMPAEVEGLVNPLALLATGPEPESCHGNDLRLGRAAVMARQNQVKTTQRNIRKLEREHGLELRFAKTRTERDRFIAAALDQKQRRFDQTKLAGFHAEPEKKLFFEQATEALSDAGLLEFCALIIGDEIVATSWNLTYGKSYIAVMLTHDDTVWGRVGPSRLLNYLLLDRLLETDFEYYDLGFGDEPYKVQQCETSVPLQRSLFASTSAGRLYLAASRLREDLRQTRLWWTLKGAKWAVQNRLRR